MPRFGVSDGACFHRKVVRAGNEAIGALWRAGSWCSAPENLTDGHVPREVAETIAPARVWKRLVEAGLVEVTADGWQIHGYLEHNPSAAKVKAERAGWVERQRRARDARRDQQAPSPGDCAPESRDLSRRDTHGDSRPRHTRPDPDPDPRSSHTLPAGAREAGSELPPAPPTVPSARPEDRGRDDDCNPTVDRLDPTRNSGKDAGATTTATPPSIASIPPSSAPPWTPPAPSPSVDPGLVALVKALAAQRSIAEAADRSPAGSVVALRVLAETVLGRMHASGRRLEDVIRAIGEAGADLSAEAGPSWTAAAKVVRTYTDRALPPRDPKAPARIGRGSVQQQPPEGPLYKPSQDF